MKMLEDRCQEDEEGRRQKRKTSKLIAYLGITQ